MEIFDYVSVYSSVSYHQYRKWHHNRDEGGLSTMIVIDFIDKLAGNCQGILLVLYFFYYSEI
jgi:hypothetical protein